MLTRDKRPFSRSWRDFFCSLGNSSLRFFKPVKDINSKGKLIDEIPVLHGLASAFEYKRPFVFSLRSLDGGIFLFQCENQAAVDHWIDSINWVAAIYSTKPLPMAASSNSNTFLPPSMPRFPSSSIIPSAAFIAERQNWLSGTLDSLKTCLFDLVGKESSQPHYEDKLNYLNWQIKKYSIYQATLITREQIKSPP